MVKVCVPATVANLGPGFDCLGMAIGLENELSMETAPAGVTVTAEGEGVGELPADAGNLAYRAAHMVFEATGFAPGGLRIHLKNRVPLARGLGSSAAAIVGAMVAANRLAGGRLTREELLGLAVALEGHPDNAAPALYGGVTAVCQDGAAYKVLSLAPPPGLGVVVAIPDFHLATVAARGVLPQSVSRQDAVFNVGHAAYLTAALATGKLDQLGFAMEDRLHQPYRADLVPGLAEVFAGAREAGALGVALSGAGPSVMAFVPAAATGTGGDAAGPAAVVQAAMVGAFAARGITARTLVVAISPTGARIG